MPRTPGIRSTLGRITSRFALCGALALAATPAVAQDTSAALPTTGLRPALEARLALQDSLARTGVESARAEAERLRERLRDGDFRVGDRVIIAIENSTDYPPQIVEPFRDTLLVSEVRTITVPHAGVISLAGVLRPELDSILTDALSRVFVTPPRIITRVSIPVTVAGEVARQGFHQVPPTIRVADLIQQVGPTGSADINRIIVRRNGQELIGAKRLRAEIARGATLDQLGIQAGDEIFVNQRREPFRWTHLIGITSAVLGLVWAIDRLSNR